MTMAERKRDMKTIASNRKARHDFEIIDTLEAGLVLKGSEVKSLREGKVNIQDSHARIEKGELWLHHMHIPVYKQANMQNHPEYRPRKLLIHKKELRKLQRQIEEKGMTLIPLLLYFSEKNRVKVQLALARGKKLYDKRESIAKKDVERSLAREFRHR